MSFLSPKMPPLPPVQPLPPPPSSELSSSEKERIAKEQAAIRRKQRGRRSTIITGPLGIVEDKEEALDTLLGKN
tara:strand:+ start:1618 stop:1839 length:222 start_codon:yes stop_codon:yes gene_type:complete